MLNILIIISWVISCSIKVSPPSSPLTLDASSLIKVGIVFKTMYWFVSSVLFYFEIWSLSYCSVASASLSTMTDSLFLDGDFDLLLPNMLSFLFTWISLTFSAFKIFYSLAFKNWIFSSRSNRFVFINLKAQNAISLSIWLWESAITISSISCPMFGSSSICIIWMISKYELNWVITLYANIFTFRCVVDGLRKISHMISLINFSQSGTAPLCINLCTALRPSTCFWISLFESGWLSFYSSVKWLKLSWLMMVLYCSIYNNFKNL